METSILLGKFWGLYLLIFGLLFNISPLALDRLFNYFKDDKFVLLIGYISFVIGLVSLLLHNIWTPDWRSMVSICGWISLIKGTLRLGYPNEISAILSKMNMKGKRIWLTGVALTGGLLLYAALTEEGL